MFINNNRACYYLLIITVSLIAIKTISYQLSEIKMFSLLDEKEEIIRGLR
jgi:hypothetical protein